MFGQEVSKVSVACEPPAYMDDVAVPLDAETSEQLVRSVENMRSVLLEVPRKFC